ncbi:hypothetical protein PRK78_002561 [Emydomyces testavorans]|uniref:Uncharacterized protein n=1 Tax=Emydomyces testavorans TaxID=2070801 RepID=A0AAF0IHX6_9EURO|nr:hypothetical protein PRK78_002561 [Emydomyces testavorans]
MSDTSILKSTRSRTKKSTSYRMPSLPMQILPSFHSNEAKENRAHTDPTTGLKSPARRFFSSHRSRSKSPAPIVTNPISPTAPHPLVASPTERTFPHADYLLDSPPPISPMSSPVASSPTEQRSHSSTMSGKKRHSYTSRKSSSSTSTSSSSSSSDYKRLSGTVNYCGRHANDWLFGGFSVRESVRGLLREDHEDEREKGGDCH